MLTFTNSFHYTFGFQANQDRSFQCLLCLEIDYRTVECFEFRLDHQSWLKLSHCKYIEYLIKTKLKGETTDKHK